jgi:hypothetical protein
MTEEILIKIILNDNIFADGDLNFLLNNQMYNNKLIFLKTCLYCESFFLRFLKIFFFNNYFVYTNVYNIYICDDFLVFNTVSVFAI